MNPPFLQAANLHALAQTVAAVAPTGPTSCESGCDEPATRDIHYVLPDRGGFYPVCDSEDCWGDALAYIDSIGGDVIETLPIPQVDGIRQHAPADVDSVELCQQCRTPAFEIATVTSSGANYRIRACDHTLAPAIRKAEKEAEGFVPTTVIPV